MGLRTCTAFLWSLSLSAPHFASPSVPLFVPSMGMIAAILGAPSLAESWGTFCSWALPLAPESPPPSTQGPASCSAEGTALPGAELCTEGKELTQKPKFSGPQTTVSPSRELQLSQHKRQGCRAVPSPASCEKHKGTLFLPSTSKHSCFGLPASAFCSHPTLDGVQVQSHRALVTSLLALQPAHCCLAPSCRQHRLPLPQVSHPVGAPAPAGRDPSTVPLPPGLVPSKASPFASLPPRGFVHIPSGAALPLYLLTALHPTAALLCSLRCTACSSSPSRCTTGTAAGAFSCSELLYRGQLLFVKAFFVSAGWRSPALRSGFVRGQGVYKYFIPRCVPVNSVTYFGLMMYVCLDFFPMDVFVPCLFVFTNKAY